MKDIKSLYLAAKNSGNQRDISSYTEAVQEILESNPNDFISNLGYIIKSDINLPSLDNFVERYGLSIPVCNTVIELLSECVEKCSARKLDSSLYKTYLEKFEAFRNSHRNCFNMFEFYRESLGNCKADYNATYYGHNSKGIPNRKLPAGMIGMFGEAAIPDMLLVAESTNSLNQFLEYFSAYFSTSSAANPTASQWVVECANDFAEGFADTSIDAIRARSLDTLVGAVINRNNQVIREAVIMGNDDAVTEYSEEDIKNIQDLIAFKEYQLTCTESAESAITIQNEIYSLYEELDGIVNEDGSFKESDSLKDDLADEMDESLRVLNTRNKYTGDAPGYLANNHDLRDRDYGDNSEKEPTLDDYRRPSASSDDVPATSNNDSDPDPEPEDDEKPSKEDQRAVNNYYYYTYTNSLNKNTGSFNRTQSDDHSTNKGDNRGNTDNHSSGDNRGNTYNGKHDEVATESVGVVAASIFFGLPLVLIGAGLAYYWIDNKITTHRSNKTVLNDLCKITGAKVKSADSYITSARKYFKDFINRNNDAIEKVFYKFDKAGVKRNPDVFLTYPYDKDENNPLHELIFATSKCYEGLIEKKHVEKIVSGLNSLNKDIKFRISKYGDLPGDDNGGAWRYYINAGICDGGPEDYNGSDSEYNDWINRQLSKIEKSDYIAVSIELYMDAKTYITTEFKESVISLDFPFENGIFTEASKLSIPDKLYEAWWTAKKSSNNKDEAQAKLFKKLYKKDLATVKLDKVPDTVTIKIGNTDFTFKTKVGNGYKDDGRTYITLDDVPCAIYLYQSNKERICSKLGIESKLMEYMKLLYNEDPGYYDNNGISKSIDENFTRYKFKADTMFFNQIGYIGLTFGTDLEPEHGIGIVIGPSMDTEVRDSIVFESVYTEAVGDADDMKPQSDNPVRETLQDVDRKLTKVQQGTKKRVQSVMNTGKVFMKPVKRTHEWVSKLANDWKDNDENKVKEKLADPTARKNVFSAISWCIKTGSFLKAGLLLNPIFLFLTITKGVGKNKKEFRLRNEMIGELKTELTVIDEKIEDARRAGDNQAKYKLMRLKNEIDKKLKRVGGSYTRSWRTMI